MTADAFMEGIAGLIRDLIRQNTAPDPAYSSLFGSKSAANRKLSGPVPGAAALSMREERLLL